MRTSDRKILLCELHQDAGSYLDSAISSLDYSVQRVQNRDEILKYLLNSEPRFLALVISIAAPDQSAFDLLRDVRGIDSGVPMIVVADPCSARSVVTAVKQGASDFLCSPVDRDELNRVLTGAMEAAAAKFRVGSRDGRAVSSFRSANPVLREIELRAEKIGWSGAPVLIQGETGSGKEMLAKVLHANSPRASKPFLKLNCAALPPELVESELFGYERGAFTGAFERKVGIFEVADGGTILLDEIGDMDIRLQAKLLQVLQDQEFRRIGGRDAVKVDVRVIAATHRDLKAAISSNSFREDLYYRLNVVVLHVPALRDRVEDLIPLAEFLIAKHSPANVPGPTITAGLRQAMMAYSWPGNVRELENFMRNLIIFRDPDALAAELRSRTRSRSNELNKPEERHPAANEIREDAPVFEQVTKVNKQAETNAIVAALNATRWNRKRAAAMLKLDYKSLLYKMKRLSIDDQPIAVAAHSDAYSTAKSPGSLKKTAAG